MAEFKAIRTNKTIHREAPGCLLLCAVEFKAFLLCPILQSRVTPLLFLRLLSLYKKGTDAPFSSVSPTHNRRALV